MENRIKIISVVLGILLIVIFIMHSFFQKVEITEVGEIPKAFLNPKPELPIKEPKKIEPKKSEIPSIVSDKTIYLTFDDGPSYLTNQILDILKKENIAATFFVIGRSIDEYENTVKRAYNEGHTIALHSFSHDYKYIYSADQNYFDDLNKIKNKIYNITGNNSRIIRLPGGSSNTVSKKYNKDIVTRITNKLNENDYYYFDWNVDSGDASGKLTKEQIYHNTILALHQGQNVVLMHDTGAKKTTVEALPDIIKYAKDNGYTFARITKDTRTTHHHINN